MADTQSIVQREPTEQERNKWAAEARKADAEARKFSAEAEEAEHKAVVARLEREEKEQLAQRKGYADAYNDRVFRFIKQVTEASVLECINALAAWHREDPNCDIEILFDSPGGSVVDGMHLFDYIIELRESGHTINTRTRGMAASMAGILLQAGEKRTMGAQASLMIHEASFGASGKLGDVEDTVEWVKKIQERILDIFALRCQTSNPEFATKPLTKTQLKNRWRRKNWWLDADEALKYGLIDEIS